MYIILPSYIVWPDVELIIDNLPLKKTIDEKLSERKLYMGVRD